MKARVRNGCVNHGGVRIYRRGSLRLLLVLKNRRRWNHRRLLEARRQERASIRLHPSAQSLPPNERAAIQRAVVQRLLEKLPGHRAEVLVASQIIPVFVGQCAFRGLCHADARCRRWLKYSLTGTESSKHSASGTGFISESYSCVYRSTSGSASSFANSGAG